LAVVPSSWAVAASSSAVVVASSLVLAVEASSLVPVVEASSLVPVVVASASVDLKGNTEVAFVEEYHPEVWAARSPWERMAVEVLMLEEHYREAARRLLYLGTVVAAS
jgi:hypothetical protein